MSQAAKDAKRAARKAARTRQFATENARAHAGAVNPLCRIADVDGLSTWPTDFSDMARRIAREGGATGWGVSRRDRDVIARNAPTGTFTRRDGKSVWSHLLDADALPTA